MPTHFGNRTQRTVSRRRRPTGRRTVGRPTGRGTVGRPTGRGTVGRPTGRRTIGGNRQRSVTRRTARTARTATPNGNRRRVVNRNRRPQRQTARTTRFGRRPNNIGNRILGRNSASRMVCAGQLVSCPTRNCTADCTPLSPAQQSMVK
ncbi:MAG: hypothetical protein H8D94_01105 [Candidatus Pelagibacter sp.]|nr:hypothetical protein [Candidatus Pelagibacter sp.]